MLVSQDNNASNILADGITTYRRNSKRVESSDAALIDATVVALARLLGRQLARQLTTADAAADSDQASGPEAG